MTQSPAGRIEANKVALAHDAMVGEYDVLEDLWYPHLFGQIHDFIAANLPPTADERVTALDVGCGTGFQSFLLARAGYSVLGFDLARELVELANDKINTHAQLPLSAPPLFSSHIWPNSARHHERLSAALERHRTGRTVRAPTFTVADACTFDYPHASFDVIVCCGSVLSFIDEWRAVLARIGDALKPGGVLFIEVEQRINLDLLWPVLDRLSGGRLGYDQDWEQIVRNLFAPPGVSLRVDYPFELKDGREVVLPLWIFSVTELEREFRRLHLQIVDRIGVHWATNLIPSTALHRVDPPPWLRWLAQGLMRVDHTGARTWPFWRLGCSVVFCMQRRG